MKVEERRTEMGINGGKKWRMVNERKKKIHDLCVRACSSLQRAITKQSRQPSFFDMYTSVTLFCWKLQLARNI